MTNLLTTLPKEDAFFMPAEFAPHAATVMIWPTRPGSWGKDPRAAQKAFADCIAALSRREKVYVIAGAEDASAARAALGNTATVIEIETDDAWARDTAPTFLLNANGELRSVSWRFNAWGGEYDGLYASWERDDALAARLAKMLNVPCYDAGDFVLEGGSIHSDGEGTVMVTEACLLSPGRNPQLTKTEIEEKLKAYLGAEKILWLPRGIYNDETNEHVDNVCAFIRPAEVVLAWTDNQNDPQYALSKASLDYLSSVTDAKGRRITIHRLPIPDTPVCITEDDLKNLVFEPGEDTRESGERLAASYVNFYFGNGVVLLPQFGGENAESDRRAVRIMEKLCPDREIVPVDARAILVGGGNIHCVTQQIPQRKEQ